MVGKATQRLKICFRVKLIKNTLQVYSSKTAAKLHAVLYHQKSGYWLVVLLGML